MIRWIGVREFGASLIGIASAVDAAAFEALSEIANMIADKAKEYATRRPGPLVQSGSLRRGIKVSPITKVGRWWETTVGPTVLYSRRVELGYKGTDSLGRVYDQAGYPFFTPAYEEVMAMRTGEIFIKRFSEALRRG